MHFYSYLYALKKTSQSISHPKIALNQARLTPKFFQVGLQKKIYLDGMNILSILLRLELRREADNQTLGRDYNGIGEKHMLQVIFGRSSLLITPY
jgi:hypothetical protein